jgi:FkbM family methyltransferase
MIVPCVLNGDFPINLPDYRANQPHWNLLSGWEKPRLRAIHERIGPGDVVYEIGSEEGEFPALFQLWGAKVVLFEPQHKYFPNMRAIWEANHLEEPLASFVGFASNATKPLGEVLHYGWPPCAHEEVTGTNHGFIELYNAAEVNPQIKIDDVAHMTSPPTCLSVDVEGAEWEVLKGAEQTIREHHPILFVSIHPEYLWTGFRCYSRDLRDWIMGFGYREELLQYEHEAHFMYEPA